MRYTASATVIALLVFPALSHADDSFVYSRQYATQKVLGSEASSGDDPQSQTAYPIEQPVQPAPQAYAPQQPQPQAPNYAPQGYAQQGYAAQPNPAQYGQAVPVQSIQQYQGQSQYNVPATPPGWDSLTTGEANGGGVIGSANGGGTASGMFTGDVNSRLMGTNMPQNIIAGLSSAGDNGYGYADGTVASVSSAKERAMYGAFLNSMLQFVQSQPNGTPVTNPDNSYGGGGWRSINGAAYQQMPAMNTMPAMNGYSGSVGVSPPAAIPCVRGSNIPGC